MNFPKELKSCKSCEHIVAGVRSCNSEYRCKYHTIWVRPEDCCDNFDTTQEIMASILQTYSEIIDAYLFLREHNHTIPSETLDFMKRSSIEALKNG